MKEREEEEEKVGRGRDCDRGPDKCEIGSGDWFYWYGNRLSEQRSRLFEYRTINVSLSSIS